MTILFPEDHFLTGRSATSVEPTQASWSPPPEGPFPAFHSVRAGCWRPDNLVPSPPSDTPPFRQLISIREECSLQASTFRLQRLQEEPSAELSGIWKAGQRQLAEQSPAT